MEYKHIPVMLKEVMKYLHPETGQYFIDCTLGGGGYTRAISEKVGMGGKILAIDLDEMAIKNFQLKNVILANDNFKNLAKIVPEHFKDKDIKFDGIVFDLGLSSAQLEDRHRGFSFLVDGPLDMSFAHREWPRIKERMAANISTEEIVNKWKKEELERILREYGEERFARRIAERIVKYRESEPVKTTGQLVEIIRNAIPAKYRKGPIHFATRTFQALRIATNDELGNLKSVLPQAVSLLKSGGCITIISFHSLEDRIVKEFFKKESLNCVCPPRFPVCRCDQRAKIKILTPKPLTPGAEEIKNNPRARSAKMRVAEKI